MDKWILFFMLGVPGMIIVWQCINIFGVPYSYGRAEVVRKSDGTESVRGRQRLVVDVKFQGETHTVEVDDEQHSALTKGQQVQLRYQIGRFDGRIRPEDISSY